MGKRVSTMLTVLLLPGGLAAQDTLRTQQLEEVTVASRQQSILRLAGAQNAVRIGKEELFRAACCNLGESFTTNPSVDVSYSDAATGAQQIRLLGLSGTYVQMLTENLPNFRGAAAPFALSYVPGPWMKSIQVSKGAASVRNGYESITGQIDVEYLKPEEDEGAAINIYGNTKSRFEANADANIHLRPRLNAELLAHYENDGGHHDDNSDGFLDQPDIHQWHLQSRWDYLGPSYIFHGGVALLREEREGGQHSTHGNADAHPYLIDITTNRYEAYMKHAIILDPNHGTNLALMTSASLHLTDATYGHKAYDGTERNLYGQLLFEHHFNDRHGLSAGLSLNVDNTNNTDETTPGAYAQYTLHLSDCIIAMAGARIDHSSIYGTFLTPRLHLKVSPFDALTLRLSAGKGYRTPHPLAENHNLLASGRKLVVDDHPGQEEAWNYGISVSGILTLAGKPLRLSAEYYYTDFIRQTVIDYDSHPSELRITALDGDSYSHTFQIDATYPLLKELTLSAACRLNDVKATYGSRLMRQPLTSRYKGLVSASYKTPLGLWQADVTLQLNGGGRMPTPVDGLWDDHFPAYEQLQAQLTRWFRHFSVYIGGENLTAFRQHHPIISSDQPWSPQFDATMVWGPLHGAVLYAGIRMNFGNRL